MRKCLWLLLFCLCCAAAAGAEGNGVSVRKVENLPADFLFGMDVSSVPAEEASGVRYFDAEGVERDLFAILADSGINAVRVRVWNDPYDSGGRGYGGGNCDIRNAVAVGRRAAKYGLPLLVDFHYSDFWADPGKQMVPKAWQGMDAAEKSEAVYAFTRESLLQLKSAGVKAALVQVGNETNQKMCGEDRWENILPLMRAGARAVREVYPEALVALHFTNPETPGRMKEYAAALAAGHVDYDVFATSYYPCWHGSLENLSAVLTEAAETCGKRVMVMETAYPFTDADSDFSGNTVGADSRLSRPYPYTVQGQADAVRDVTDAVVNGTPAGIGVVYWEGAWIAVGRRSWAENHALWEQYGSGWASSYAGSYDPEDAGRYYGGSAMDNQAFFDSSGRALPSLQVFRLMREGSGSK